MEAQNRTGLFCLLTGGSVSKESQCEGTRLILGLPGNSMDRELDGLQSGVSQKSRTFSD